MTKKVLSIDGMSCNHCKMAIEKSVSNLEGVDNVEVSLKNKTAIIDYDENILTLEKIKEAIEESGYNVA